jgi:hypothetical protein
MKKKITFDCEQDLDLIKVRKRALAEFELCRTNLITGIDSKTGRDRQGRTEDDMRGAFFRGHCLEVYLLDHQGYMDDERDYQDVLERGTLDPVAVKVTKPTEWHIDFTKDKLKIEKNNRALDWKEHPDKLIIFTNNDKDSKYTFYANYVWEKNDWKEVSFLDKKGLHSPQSVL